MRQKTELIVGADFTARTYKGRKLWKNWYAYVLGGSLVGTNQTWGFDLNKIEKACTKLGLNTIPKIDVTFDYLAVAKHSSRESHISIHCQTDRQWVSVCLWHELTHCLQNQWLGEELATKYPKIISADILGWNNYWNNELEVEARSNEPYGLEFSLIKEL